MTEPDDAKADLWAGVGCGFVILCAAGAWSLVALVYAFIERAL